MVQWSLSTGSELPVSHVQPPECARSPGRLVCIHRIDISFSPLIFFIVSSVDTHRENIVLFSGENARGVSVSPLRVKTVLHRDMEIVEINRRRVVNCQSVNCLVG